MFSSKLCKSNRNCTRNFAFISCIYLLYGICVNIFIVNRCISKSNSRSISKSYSRSKNTIYRVGAAVVSTITGLELLVRSLTLGCKELVLVCFYFRSRSSLHHSYCRSPLIESFVMSCLLLHWTIYISQSLVLVL